MGDAAVDASMMDEPGTAARTTQSPSRKNRIAVVGSGIGGLAAAAFLSRAGADVTVYEQAPELREVGAGLIVPPNAVRLLRRLGGLDRLRSASVPMEVGWEFRRWADGTVLFSQRLGDDCERLYGERPYLAHRADLLSVVREAVADDALRLGARLVEVRRRSGDVVLEFADGSSATADVVVGADGVHSLVRDAVVPPAPPRFSGLCAYRCLVAAEHAPHFARRPVQTLWLGPGRHLVHYPVSAGRLVNVVAFAPSEDWTTESWSARGRVEDLAGEFAEWDPRLGRLIGAADSTGRWALYDRDPLSTWTSGPIALLGDAAHPMFPFLAQGAAQAIEDAAVLARCLAEDPGRPEAALARYERTRLPRATEVQLRSRGRQHSNHLPDGPEQRARDAAFADEDPLGHNAWLYGHDAERSLTSADGDEVREQSATGEPSE